jgi:chromosome partitioning protein
MEGLLSTQQVADRLGVDIKTVRRYLHSGKLRGVRLGRDYRIAEAALVGLLTPRKTTTDGVQTARIIAVVNQKGGVGKTATTFNLGTALQRLDKRVLLVDLDPQGALSVSAGIPIAHLSATVYQTLLDDKIDPVALVHKTTSGVEVLPANIDLAGAEIELVNMTLREVVLKDVLAKLRSRYDYVLIDCPPSLGLLTINALAAADEVVIPVACEFLATRGLALLLRTINRTQERLNRDLRIGGILPTRYDSRTNHAAEVLHELKVNFPDQLYDVVIKETVRLKVSPAAGMSFLDYDRTGEAAHAYMKLASEVDRG